MRLETDKEIRTALLVQYEVLQNRIGLHGSRLWQLPFTYVSFSAIATPVALANPSAFPLSTFFFALGLIGLLVMACMNSAWRGYKRTGENMNDVEARLGLRTYTKYGYWHCSPYFLLCGCVVAAILSLSIFLAKQPDVHDTASAVPKAEISNEK